MIVEIRTYTLVPGGARRWVDIYKQYGLETQTRILPKMIGYFVTEIGPLNQIVHMWGYDSYEQRTERRAALVADKDWQVFVEKAAGLLVQQETRLLNPTDFSPIR